jgi:hypothetical protein
VVIAGLPAAGLLATQEASPAVAASALTTLAANWQALTPSSDITGKADTAAIASALAGLPDGGSLWLAPGLWYVNGPIVPKPGQRISGLHGANQSGDGAAQGYGTVIKAVGSSWPATNGVSGVFSYTSALGQGEITDLWIDCSKFTGTSLCGVAAAGAVNAISLRNVGVYRAPSHGFLLAPDQAAPPNLPDGWYLDTCLAQTCGGDGFSGHYVDATLMNCHAQTCSGDGFMMTGSNTKLIGCRGDLCTNGFTIDVAGGGGYNDATVLTGCGTQRNQQSGLNVTNSSAVGNSDRDPVIVDGCTFGGDGRNGGTGGGYLGGIRVRGRNIVMIGSASVTVDSFSGEALCPAYGLSVGPIGTGNAEPILVTMGAGLLNGATSPYHNNTTTTSFQLSSGVFGATGYRPTSVTGL